MNATNRNLNRCRIGCVIVASLFLSYAGAEPRLSNTADEFTKALSAPKPKFKLRGIKSIADDNPQVKPEPQTNITTTNPTPPPSTSTPTVAIQPQTQPQIATPSANYNSIAAQNYVTLTETHATAATLVQFETNSDRIQRQAYGVLNELVKALQNNLPDAVLLIAGHTDSKGSASYNLRLSQRRAQSVKNYLVNRGISPSRLIVKGYGEHHPMASNNTANGRALNRRSEFIRIGSL